MAQNFDQLNLTPFHTSLSLFHYDWFLFFFIIISFFLFLIPFSVCVSCLHLFNSYFISKSVSRIRSRILAKQFLRLKLNQTSHLNCKDEKWNSALWHKHSLGRAVVVVKSHDEHYPIRVVYFVIGTLLFCFSISRCNKALPLELK